MCLVLVVLVVLVDRGKTDVWITLVRAPHVLLADLLQNRRVMDTAFRSCQLSMAGSKARGLTGTATF